MLIGCSSASNPPWSVVCRKGSLARSSRYAVTAEVSGATCKRRARPNARRRTAYAKHSGSGCSHAPRPGSRRRGSGTTRAPEGSLTATNRTSTDQLSARRQPTHVRTGEVSGVVRAAVRSPDWSVAPSLPCDEPCAALTAPSATCAGDERTSQLRGYAYRQNLQMHLRLVPLPRRLPDLLPDLPPPRGCRA